jgi:hypothetical protein
MIVLDCFISKRIQTPSEELGAPLNAHGVDYVLFFLFLHSHKEMVNTKAYMYLVLDLRLIKTYPLTHLTSYSTH